ncbi:DUF6106 family protein [Clostridium sp.]|uniref:DUF6106 family protein n=1 Tax=Clostridium sp. TaxID=1506 RepID=UPI003F6721F4
MDKFYEQFLTTDYGNKEKNFKLISSTLIVLALMSAVVIGFMGSIVCLVGYVIVEIIARAVLLEYEYELTENELVISKIMNKKKRKVITTIDIENIVDVNKVQDGNSRNAKLIKACVDNSGLNEQIIFVTRNSEVVGFKVAMDKKLLLMCKRVNPLNFSRV